MKRTAYPRYRYVIAAVAFIDLPLWIEIRRHDWMLVALIIVPMLAITFRRMTEIGWDGIWAVPYCFMVVSPFAVLVLWPHVNAWFVFACVAALHLPLMVWPSLGQESP